MFRQILNFFKRRTVEQSEIKQIAQVMHVPENISTGPLFTPPKMRRIHHEWKEPPAGTKIARDASANAIGMRGRVFLGYK